MEATSISRNDLLTLRTALLLEERAIADRAVDRAFHYRPSPSLSLSGSLSRIYTLLPIIISIISLLPGFGRMEHPRVNGST